MRIVAVVPQYPPGSRVGAWLATHEFLAGLAAAGHDVDVVCELGAHGRPYTLDGVTVRSGASRIEEFVPEADGVVSHAGDSGRAHRVAVATGVPSVRMVHGGDVTADRLAGASLVVWNSVHAMQACGWDGPQVVCHPPVWPARHRTTPGAKVTIVNCSVAKGINTAWLAAMELPDVAFLGVSGGYGTQRVPRCQNFETIPTTNDMRRDVWARTRVLLMPSEHESWGMVGIEAMCSGIPVIANPTPGLVESLGPAGVFVDRDDIDGWVREIRRLLDPDEWAAASAAALARVDDLDPAADVARFVQAVEIAPFKQRCVMGTSEVSASVPAGMEA